ncbi:hypothetical protein NG726_11540 [Pseudomonas sp. MOB-449]|nr:hypothetical protein [Pseudomonas sp. MOB-449]
MLEFISNPPWWVILIIGWLLPPFGWLRSQLPRLAGHARGSLVSFWNGRVRSFFRALERRRLVKIKRARFHSVIINREIARSYAFLVLFVLSTLIYCMGLVSIPTRTVDWKQLQTIWMSISAPAMLFFELLWLLRSNRVDALIKYRRKIRPVGRRLT